jgi:hypothetical protein
LCGVDGLDCAYKINLFLPPSRNSNDDKSSFSSSPKVGVHEKTWCNTSMNIPKLVSRMKNITLKPIHSFKSVSSSSTSIHLTGLLRSNKSPVFPDSQPEDLENFLTLDNNILKIERKLFIKRTILIHCAEDNKENRRIVIKYLADSWRMTDFTCVYQVNKNLFREIFQKSANGLSKNS